MLRRHFANAAELHRSPPRVISQRTLSVQVARRDAWVLGSTSSAKLEERCRQHAAARSTPVDVVRRNSGGGLVWLDAAEASWVDVFVPTGDPLYRFDVSASTLWLGRAIAAALTTLGIRAAACEQPELGTLVTSADVRAGRATDGDLCMATIGRGEVVVDDAAKLVGISQRRNRAGARMSCVWYRHVNPAPYLELLGSSASDYLCRFGGWADADLSTAATVLDQRSIDRAVVNRAVVNAITSVTDGTSYPAPRARKVDERTSQDRCQMSETR